MKRVSCLSIMYLTYSPEHSAKITIADIFSHCIEEEYTRITPAQESIPKIENTQQAYLSEFIRQLSNQQAILFSLLLAHKQTTIQRTQPLTVDIVQARCRFIVYKCYTYHLHAHILSAQQDQYSTDNNYFNYIITPKQLLNLLIMTYQNVYNLLKHHVDAMNTPDKKTKMEYKLLYSDITQLTVNILFPRVTRQRCSTLSAQHSTTDNSIQQLEISFTSATHEHMPQFSPHAESISVCDSTIHSCSFLDANISKTSIDKLHAQQSNSHNAAHSDSEDSLDIFLRSQHHNDSISSIDSTAITDLIEDDDL